MTAPKPIRVPCEGGGHPVARRAAVQTGLCAMCGCPVFLPTESNDVAPLHNRNDVLAMLERGDFG